MSQNRTSTFFSSYALDFDAIYGNDNNLWQRFINHFFRKSMKLRYIKSMEGCNPIEGKTAIDVGCGPGHYCIQLVKSGAAAVTGIDFAKDMIELAKKKAEAEGVLEKCTFICDDFMATEFPEKFDYAIVMGFMDYVKNPEELIDKVLSVTKNKAFFSFPIDGGFLALKRKWKYKHKFNCDLYMYSKKEVQELFAGKQVKNLHIQKISRDLFVTVSLT